MTIPHYFNCIQVLILKDEIFSQTNDGKSNKQLLIFLKVK